jgi:hypothetical protein
VKPLPTMLFASVMMAALAAAEGRQMTLVKGSPTTDSFDISWVDNATQKDYLSDRTNNAVDLVDAATDTFLGSIGKGQYTGSRPCPGRPNDLRHCSGPNGVVTDNLGHVWAGDGAGNIIEAASADMVRFFATIWARTGLESATFCSAVPVFRAAFRLAHDARSLTLVAADIL